MLFLEKRSLKQLSSWYNPLPLSWKLYSRNLFYSRFYTFLRKRFLALLWSPPQQGFTFTQTVAYPVEVAAKFREDSGTLFESAISLTRYPQGCVAHPRKLGWLLPLGYTPKLPSGVVTRMYCKKNNPRRAVAEYSPGEGAIRACEDVRCTPGDSE